MRMNKYLFAAIAVTTFSCLNIASAQDRLLKELYVKAGLNSTRLTDSAGTTLVSGTPYQYDIGASDTIGYELAVGATALDFLRLEVSYAQDTYTSDVEMGPGGIPTFLAEVDVKSTYLMADVNLELAAFGVTPDWLRPYVGIGIGYAWHDFEDVQFDVPPTYGTKGDQNTELTWRFSIGVGLKLGENLMLDVAYSWIDAGTAESGTEFIGAAAVLSEPAELEMKAERLSAGLRFVF